MDNLCILKDVFFRSGHLEIVRLLLSAGADQSMKMGNLSAIDVAREFGQEEILELLEEKA